CNADPETDDIRFDGKPLRQKPPERIMIAVNKPAGYLSTCKTTKTKSPTVLDLIPDGTRLFPVGRLDRESSGLLLLTNDGELTNKILHPRFGFDKEYIVRVREPLTTAQMNRLRKGVQLDGHLVKPISLQVQSQTSYNIVLGEGRKREIRRMLKLVSSEVIQLHRVRIGPLKLGNIPLGKWRKLSKVEIKKLNDYKK
ncbi:pseudouridine synthase, partial [bacterium]|nr:pseudouridine synthase [bacterium]